MVGWTCSYNTPHETDGLTSSTNPADQPREEETEAESDDGVAPEHVSVEEPVHGHGGGQDPGHVANQDAANHLKIGKLKHNVCQFITFKRRVFCSHHNHFLSDSKNKIPQGQYGNGWCRISQSVGVALPTTTTRRPHSHNTTSQSQVKIKTTEIFWITGNRFRAACLLPVIRNVFTR